jgi:16S rRNA (cytidine1402-2'-O)-methyltransferase
MNANFFILGMPLAEKTAPSPPIVKIVEQCSIIIGESRRITERLLSRCSLVAEAKVFYLDNQSPQDRKTLLAELRNLSKTSGRACIFSDMGMPILFDPGKEILEAVRALSFNIRCLPGPTSWGTACALSGWLPPFLLVGFLSPKAEERVKELSDLTHSAGHIVLMDTPYRFQALLKDCSSVFGSQHQAFLAWEIGMPEETYLWGSLKELEQRTTEKNLKKGEFILVLRNPGVK